MANYTHIGTRERNEDYLIEDEENHIYIVADGIGGGPAGDLASKIVAESTHSYLNNHKVIDQSGVDKLVQYINYELSEKVKADPRLSRMGSTLVCAQIHEEGIMIIHAGDSKAFVVTHETFITKDHNYVQTLLDQKLILPEEIDKHPMKRVIVKYLCAGQVTDMLADFTLLPLIPDKSRILLCSDGVLESFSTQKLTDLLESDMNEADLMNSIIRKTQKNSKDNCSWILIQK